MFYLVTPDVFTVKQVAGSIVGDYDELIWQYHKSEQLQRSFISSGISFRPLTLHKYGNIEYKEAI